jgi:hypothetical protein
MDEEVGKRNNNIVGKIETSVIILLRNVDWYARLEKITNLA